VRFANFWGPVTHREFFGLLKNGPLVIFLLMVTHNLSAIWLYYDKVLAVGPSPGVLTFAFEFGAGVRSQVDHRELLVDGPPLPLVNRVHDVVVHLPTVRRVRLVSRHLLVQVKIILQVLRQQRLF
jgi:hypothetical protein